MDFSSLLFTQKYKGKVCEAMLNGWVYGFKRRVRTKNVAGSFLIAMLGDEGTRIENVKCNDFRKSPLKQFSVFAIFFF